MYKRLFSKNSGFTLIELIVVIAIIGIIAAVAYPLVGKFIIQAQSQSIVNDLHETYKYSNIALQEFQAKGNTDFTDADIAKRVNELLNLDVKYGYPGLRDRDKSIRVIYTEEKVLKVAYYEGMTRNPRYEIVDNELNEY